MNTRTEFIVLLGENLPNHSESLRGRGKYVRISGYHSGSNYPLVRTRQEAYRLAADFLTTAQELPNEEEEPYTWDEIFDAVLTERGMVMDDDGESWDSAGTEELGDDDDGNESDEG